MKICPTCCGTKREVEIECPSDCAHLKTGRSYEARQGPPHEKPAREFSQQFRHRNATVITLLAQAILEERSQNPALLDGDARDAFEALKATTRTLSSGIHYDTLPESGRNASGMYRRAKALIDQMMEPQGPAGETLRVGDVPDILDFIVVSIDLHSGGRPKSRRYLDWLSSVAPAPVPDDPGRLIVP